MHIFLKVHCKCALCHLVCNPVIVPKILRLVIGKSNFPTSLLYQGHYCSLLWCPLLDKHLNQILVILYTVIPTYMDTKATLKKNVFALFNKI